jgi:transcriptional regulator of acetoin/glycerol metabolism
VGRDGLALTPDAVAALKAYTWPGNVRELKNVLLRASATAPTTEIRADDLTLEDALVAPGAARVERGSGGTLQQVTTEAERGALLSTLETCSWNFARAAQQLGISRMTLYRRLEKCGISRASAR